MKRKLLLCIFAILLFLLPILATAASPGFVCDNCDYESAAAGQRDITVAKDGGTVKVREYFCPSCKTVVSSIEIPGSYQNSPAEDPVEVIPAPSSNESQETNPPKPAENTSAGNPAGPSGTGSSSTVVIPVSPVTKEDTPNNSSSSNTQAVPVIVNVQPEQPVADTGASTNIVPEQPATSAVIIYPEQQATNTGTNSTGTANNGPAGSGDSAVVVYPEQPVINLVTNNTGTTNTNPVGTQPSDSDAPIVLVPLDQPSTSGNPSNISPIIIQPEQPVTSRDSSNQSEQQTSQPPATQQNTQAIIYVEPESVTEREPIRVEPEYPVSSIDTDQRPSSGPSKVDTPVVLVTDKPPVSTEAPQPIQVRPELTAPPVPDLTLPPVIGEDPTFTPPPVATPAVAQTPNPFRASSIGSANDEYPAFSRCFPARRLRLKGDPEAQATRAGILIWPEEPGMSLLEKMLNANP